MFFSLPTLTAFRHPRPTLLFHSLYTHEKKKYNVREDFRIRPLVFPNTGVSLKKHRNTAQTAHAHRCYGVFLYCMWDRLNFRVC
jgi:hypothetical protein